MIGLNKKFLCGVLAACTLYASFDYSGVHQVAKAISVQTDSEIIPNEPEFDLAEGTDLVQSEQFTDKEPTSDDLIPTYESDILDSDLDFLDEADLDGVLSDESEEEIIPRIIYIDDEPVGVIKGTEFFDLEDNLIGSVDADIYVYDSDHNLLGTVNDDSQLILAASDIAIYASDESPSYPEPTEANTLTGGEITLSAGVYYIPTDNPNFIFNNDITIDGDVTFLPVPQVISGGQTGYVDVQFANVILNDNTALHFFSSSVKSEGDATSAIDYWYLHSSIQTLTIKGYNNEVNRINPSLFSRSTLDINNLNFPDISSATSAVSYNINATNIGTISFPDISSVTGALTYDINADEVENLSQISTSFNNEIVDDIILDFNFNYSKEYDLRFNFLKPVKANLDFSFGYHDRIPHLCKFFNIVSSAGMNFEDTVDGNISYFVLDNSSQNSDDASMTFANTVNGNISYSFTGSTTDASMNFANTVNGELIYYANLTKPEQAGICLTDTVTNPVSITLAGGDYSESTLCGINDITLLQGATVIRFDGGKFDYNKVFYTFDKPVSQDIDYTFFGSLVNIPTYDAYAGLIFNNTVTGNISSSIAVLNNLDGLINTGVGLVFNSSVEGNVASNVKVEDATKLKRLCISGIDNIDGEINFDISANKFEGQHLGLGFNNITHNVAGNIRVVTVKNSSQIGNLFNGTVSAPVSSNIVVEYADNVKTIGNTFNSTVSAPIVSTIEYHLAKDCSRIGNTFRKEVSSTVDSEIGSGTVSDVKDIGDIYYGVVDDANISSTIDVFTGTVANIYTAFVKSTANPNILTTINLCKDAYFTINHNAYIREHTLSADFVGSSGAGTSVVNIGYINDIYDPDTHSDVYMHSPDANVDISTISAADSCVVNLYTGELFCNTIEGSLNLTGQNTNQHMAFYDPEKGRYTVTLTDKFGGEHVIDLLDYSRGVTKHECFMYYAPVAHVTEITTTPGTTEWVGFFYNAEGKGILYDNDVDVLLPSRLNIAYNESLYCSPTASLYVAVDSEHTIANIVNNGILELSSQVNFVRLDHPRDDNGQYVSFTYDPYFKVDVDGNYVRDENGDIVIECMNNLRDTDVDFFPYSAYNDYAIYTAPFESTEITQRYDLADFNTSVTYNGLDLKMSLLRQWIWHVHNADFYVTPPNIENITFEAADGTISKELIDPGTYKMHVVFDNEPHTFEVTVVDPNPVTVSYQNPTSISSSSVTFTTSSADCIFLDDMPDTNDQIYLTDKGTSKGWYAVRDSKLFTKRLHVSGDVHLILEDGCQLELPQGIEVFDEKSSLTIYGQEANSGVLKMLQDDSYRLFGSYYAALGATGHPITRHSKQADVEYGSVSLTVNGGTIESDYGIGYSEKAAGSASITVNGGSLSVKNILARPDKNSVAVIINGGYVKTDSISVNSEYYMKLPESFGDSMLYIRNAEVVTGDIYSEYDTDIEVFNSNITFMNSSDSSNIDNPDDSEESGDHDDFEDFFKSDTSFEKRIITDADISIDKSSIVNAEMIGITGPANTHEATDNYVHITDSTIDSAQIGFLKGTTNNFDCYISNSEISVLNTNNNGAAIGTGNNVAFYSCYISLADSIVEASADHGAAIGLGADNKNILANAPASAVLSINRGQINATAKSGAGIGTGAGLDYNVVAMDITLHDSIITAQSSCGAGIGSGANYSTSYNSYINIDIAGGEVNANSVDGAGIGNGIFGSVTIEDPFLEDPTCHFLSHMAPDEGPSNPQPRQILGYNLDSDKTAFEVAIFRGGDACKYIPHIDAFKDPLNIARGLPQYTLVADGLTNPAYVQDPSKPLSADNWGKIFQSNTIVNIGNNTIIHASSKNQEGIGANNVDDVQIAETLNGRKIPMNIYEVHYLDQNGDEMSVDQLQSAEPHDINDIYLSEIQFGANPSDYGMDNLAMNLVDISFNFTTVEDCNSIIYTTSGKGKLGISDRSGIEYEVQKLNEDGSLAVDYENNPVMETKRYAQASDDCKWSGIIFENGKGIVYQREGKVLPLLDNIMLNPSEELQIPFNTVLNLNNKSITNNGTLFVIDDSSITGAGILTGSGMFWQRKLDSKNLNIHDVEYSSLEYNKLRYMPESIYTSKYGGINLSELYGNNYNYVDYFGKTAYEKEIIPVDVMPVDIKGMDFYPYLPLWSNTFKHESFDKVLHANDDNHKYSTNFTYLEDDYIPGNFDAAVDDHYVAINEFNVKKAKALIAGSTLQTRKLSQGGFDLKLSSSSRSGIASNFPITIVENTDADKDVATVANDPIITTGSDYSRSSSYAYARQYADGAGGSVTPISNGFSYMTVNSYYDDDLYLPTDFEPATKDIIILISDSSAKPININKSYGDSDFDVLTETDSVANSTSRNNLAQLKSAVDNKDSSGSTINYTISGDAIDFVSGTPSTSVHIEGAGSSVLIITVTTGDIQTNYAVTVSVAKKTYTADDFSSVTIDNVTDTYGRKYSSQDVLSYTDSSEHITGIDGMELAGKFVWKNSNDTDRIPVGTYSDILVDFIPNDTNNYNTITGFKTNVTITEKGTEIFGSTPVIIKVPYNYDSLISADPAKVQTYQLVANAIGDNGLLSLQYSLAEGSSDDVIEVSDTGLITILKLGEAAVKVTINDTNYSAEPLTIQVKVLVSTELSDFKSVNITTDPAIYGTHLNNIVITNKGTLPIPGHFEWDMQEPGDTIDPNIIIPVVNDSHRYKVKFVPDDSDNYNPVSGFTAKTTITPAEDLLTINSSVVDNITTQTTSVNISDIANSENNLDIIASIKQSTSDGVINITDDGKIEFKKAGKVTIEFNHTSGNYKPYSSNIDKSNVNTIEITVTTHGYDISSFGNIDAGLTASEVVYGDHINNSILTIDPSMVTLPTNGTFVWDEDTILTESGVHAVKFVPDDKEVFAEVTGFTTTVQVTDRSLTTNAVDYGTLLKDIAISGDNPKDSTGTPLEGSYIWDWSDHDNNSYKPHTKESDTLYTVKFVPVDGTLSEIGGFKCAFKINAINPSQADSIGDNIDTPDDIIISKPIELGTHLLDAVSGDPIHLDLFDDVAKPTVTSPDGVTRELDGHYEWVEDAPQTPITEDTVVTIKIKYVTDDTEDYTDIEDLVAQITLTPHKISDTNLGDISLTAVPITVGQKYSDAVISSLEDKTPKDNNGQPLAGVWEWSDKDSVTSHDDISAEGIEHDVVFIPDKSTGYAVVNGFVCKLIVKRKNIPGANPDGTVPIPVDPNNPDDPVITTEAYKIQAAVKSRLHYVGETLQDDRIYGSGTSSDTAITFTDESGEVTITGTYAWNDHTTKLKVSDSNTTEFTIIFTPDESTDYAPLTLAGRTEVKPVDLNKNNLNISTDALSFEYGTSLGDSNAQPSGRVTLKNTDGSEGAEITGSFSWQYTDSITADTILDVGEHIQLAVFVPDPDSELGQKYGSISDIEFIVTVTKKQFDKDDFDKASTGEPDGDNTDDPTAPEVPGGKPEIPEGSTVPGGTTVPDNPESTIPGAGDINANGLEILPVTIPYGTKLRETDSLDFKGKVPLNIDGNPLAGKFTWSKNIVDTIPTVSQSGDEFDVIFEPTDTEHYLPIAGFKVIVTVTTGSIDINQDDITLSFGGSTTIVPVITPNDVDTFITTFEVAEEDKQYLDISSSGELTTKKITDSNGIPVTIRVTDSNGNYTEGTKIIKVIITSSNLPDSIMDILNQLKGNLTATPVMSGDTLGTSVISVNTEGVSNALADAVDGSKITITADGANFVGSFVWNEDTDTVLKIADSNKSHNIKFVPEDTNYSEIAGFGAIVEVYAAGIPSDEQTKIKDDLESDGVIGTSTYPGKIGDQDLDPSTDDKIPITLTGEITDKYTVEWKVGEDGTDMIPSSDNHSGVVVVTPKDPDLAPFELNVNIPFSEGTVTITCPDNFDKHINDNPFFIDATALNQLNQNIELEYSSSDETKAKVNKDTGEVTLVGTGAVTITVKPADENYIGSKDITVHIYSKASDKDDFVDLALIANPNTIVFGTELNSVAIEYTGTLPTEGHFEWDYDLMNIDNHYKPTVAESANPFKVVFVPDDLTHFNKVHDFSLNVSVTKKQFDKDDFDKASTEEPSGDNPAEPEVPGGKPDIPEGSTSVGDEYPNPDKPNDTIPDAGEMSEEGLDLIAITIPYGTELRVSDSLNFKGKVPLDIEGNPLAGKFTWSEAILNSYSIPNVNDSDDFDVIFEPINTEDYDIITGFTVPVIITPRVVEITASDKTITVDTVDASLDVTANVDLNEVPLNYEVLTAGIDWLTIDNNGNISTSIDDTDNFKQPVEVDIKVFTADSSGNYINDEAVIRLTITPDILDEDTLNEFKEFVKNLRGTSIVTGQTLADSIICINDSQLSNGHVDEGEYSSPLAGTFTFTDLSTIWTVASAKLKNNIFDVTFTPDNTHIAPIACSARVDVKKKQLSQTEIDAIKDKITVDDITYPEKVGDHAGTSGHDNIHGLDPSDGTPSWKDPNEQPTKDNPSATITITPPDDSEYEPFDIVINIPFKQGTPNLYGADTVIALDTIGSKVETVAEPTDYMFTYSYNVAAGDSVIVNSDTGIITTLKLGDSIITVTVHDETGNYKDAIANVKVMVIKHDYNNDPDIVDKLKKVAETLTASDVLCGETLGNSVLSWDTSITLPIPGKFEWAEDVSQILRLSDNNMTHAVKFVPANDNYYCLTDFSAKVRVLGRIDSSNKTVDADPGHPLKDNSLEGLPKPKDEAGNDISGHYEWNEPDKTITPNDDGTSQNITFIPDNPAIEPITNTITIHVTDVSEPLPIIFPTIEVKPDTRLGDILLTDIPLPSNSKGDIIQGHYEWVDPDIIVIADSDYFESEVIFVPDDPMYTGFKETVQLKVIRDNNRPIPTPTPTPTPPSTSTSTNSDSDISIKFFDVIISSVETGKSLSDIMISGIAINSDTGERIYGTFEFKDKDTIVSDETSPMYEVIFIPYNSTQQFSVGVFEITVIPKITDDTEDSSDNVESDTVSDTSENKPDGTDISSSSNNETDNTDNSSNDSNTNNTDSSLSNDNNISDTLDNTANFPSSSDDALYTNPYTGRNMYSLIIAIILLALILLCVRKHKD